MSYLNLQNKSTLERHTRLAITDLSLLPKVQRRSGSMLAMLATCLLTLGNSAAAAPHDAFLEANPQAAYGNGMIEFSVDHMNKTLDVFKLRDPSLVMAGENSGDYQGTSIRAGMGLAHNVWVDGALQQRKLTYGNDQPQLDSWRVGLQWAFAQQQGLRPAGALRLTAFGNSASVLKKSSPTAISGITLDTVQVNQPRDNMLQANAIGTWAFGPYRASGFVGAGRGKMRVNSINATLRNSGATYSDGKFDVPLLNAFAEQSGLGAELRSVNDDLTSLQMGFNLAYVTGPWRLRGGYVMQHIDRPAVDAVVKRKGQSSYNLNHTFIGEVAYKLNPHVYLLLRGQAMSNQFLTEIPFLYNSLTSQRFNERYGIVYAGVGVVF
jgi:hypothetical protein